MHEGGIHMAWGNDHLHEGVVDMWGCKWHIILISLDSVKLLFTQINLLKKLLISWLQNYQKLIVFYFNHLVMCDCVFMCVYINFLLDYQ